MSRQYTYVFFLTAAQAYGHSSGIYFLCILRRLEVFFDSYKGAVLAIHKNQ